MNMNTKSQDVGICLHAAPVCLQMYVTVTRKRDGIYGEHTTIKPTPTP